MTDQEREVMQQALDALQDLEGYRPDIDAAIIALLAALAAPDEDKPFTPDWVNYRQGFQDGRDAEREALAAPQPAQEPVARVNDDGFIVETGLTIAPGELLYTAPQPQRQPLFTELIAQHPGLAEELAAPQPAQEPVVRWDSDGWGDLLVDSLPDGTPLYSAPHQRQPLTDEFVRLVVRSKQPHLGTESKAWKDLFASCKYWLEAAHGIGDKK